MMSVAYVPALRFYRRSPLWAAAAAAGGAVLHGGDGALGGEYWRGRGGVWKGRVQDRRAERQRGTLEVRAYETS